jgi:hypothetical protein
MPKRSQLHDQGVDDYFGPTIFVLAGFSAACRIYVAAGEEHFQKRYNVYPH